MPQKSGIFAIGELSDTIYPEGLEVVPPKFAVSKRNAWMLERCEYVITYVKFNFGGAALFKEKAIKKESA